MRDTTEGPEAVEAGAARLVGTDTDTIVAEARRLLDDADAYREMARARTPDAAGRANAEAVRTLAGRELDLAPGTGHRALRARGFEDGAAIRDAKMGVVRIADVCPQEVPGGIGLRRQELASHAPPTTSRSNL